MYDAIIIGAGPTGCIAARELAYASLNGNPIDRKVITRHITHICNDANIPEINPHGFRHTCATLLISEGVPIKVVQERLRQADFRTTANIYSHVLPKMQAEANEKMSKVLKFKRPDIQQKTSQE
jgi:integrase